MYRAFHPARFKSRVVHGEAKDSYSGLAILTKTLIRDHQAVRLPGVEGDTNRWMQTLNIKIAGTAIRIMNTHLTHVCQADDTRLRQTQKILEFAGANAPQNPAILAGDFNAEASDPLMGWLENHNQTPFTRAAMDEPTVHEGARCIDHILVNRGLSVLSVDRVMEKMEGDIHPPSDHYGVMATLALQ